MVSLVCCGITPGRRYDAPDTVYFLPLFPDRGLDPAHAGGGGLFLLDLEGLQIAGVAGMGAAADLLGERAHGVHLDPLAVLRLEQVDGDLVSGRPCSYRRGFHISCLSHTIKRPPVSSFLRFCGNWPHIR